MLDSSHKCGTKTLFGDPGLRLYHNKVCIQIFGYSQSRNPTKHLSHRLLTATYQVTITWLLGSHFRLIITYLLPHLTILLISNPNQTLEEKFKLNHWLSNVNPSPLHKQILELSIWVTTGQRNLQSNLDHPASHLVIPPVTTSAWHAVELDWRVRGYLWSGSWLCLSIGHIYVIMVSSITLCHIPVGKILFIKLLIV